MSFGGYRYGGGGGMGIGAYVNPEQFAGGFNAATPITEAINIENAEAAQQQQQQMAPMETELARYKMQGAEMDANLAKSTYEDSMIAHAAKTSMDDPEKWDANFNALADQGITGAKQFVGRYSAATADRVANAYDVQSPLARATRPASGQAMPTEDDYARMLASVPDAQVPVLRDKARQVLDLLGSVHDQPSYEQAKGIAQKAGLPVQGLPQQYDPLTVKNLYDHYLPLYQHLQSRSADASLGMPGQPIPSKVENVGDTLYSVDENTPSGTASATPIAQSRKDTYIGTDAQGHPIYHNASGGLPGSGPADTVGPYKVNAKPSAGAQTFQAKMNAALAIGMNQTDATEFANGRKMPSDAQITDIAMHMAQSDMHSDVMAGKDVADPAAYVQERAQQYREQLKQQPAGAGTAAAAARVVKGSDGKMYDATGSIAAAKAAIQRNPRARAQIIAKLKSTLPGINAAGL